MEPMEKILFGRKNQIFPYRIQKSWIQVCMADRIVKIVSPGFLYNLTKHYRQDLKIGYIDASRHWLQSALNIRL